MLLVGDVSLRPTTYGAGRTVLCKGKYVSGSKLPTEKAAPIGTALFQHRDELEDFRPFCAFPTHPAAP
jgi:hypothetical protein